MCTAALIRFIAQVSLKAIRGEVVIYYGVPRASETSKMRFIRFRERSEQELQTRVDDLAGAGGLFGGEVLVVVEGDGQHV